MNRHIFLGITGLLVLIAVCFFWGANQTIADTQTTVGTQTSADIQTAIAESHKTGAQRRQEALKNLNDALNNGMGPLMTTDAVPMSTGTAPLATVPNARAIQLQTPKKGPQLKSAAMNTTAPSALYPVGIGFNPAVDYTLPNFSYSPNIRKFMDSLPKSSVGKILRRELRLKKKA